MDTRGNGRRPGWTTSALVSVGGLVVAALTGAGVWFGHEQATTGSADSSTSDAGTSSDAGTATDSGTSSDTGSSTDSGTSSDQGVSQGTTGGSGSSDATTTGS
ncbi:hypothetical protein [Curtobacterium sp. C2H10]|jgi:hypothetical protein|uniref:hypothetical protein n=1 Tax=Curtobacterium sp. C2H10 TaxID=2736664 RepID=UPI0021C17AEB|nr:hypothetical protein [Curtobacterium sp. C2H10]MCT9620627.1 hypothetical protein [Curtobacterium sp. C2H10]